MSADSLIRYRRKLNFKASTSRSSTKQVPASPENADCHISDCEQTQQVETKKKKRRTQSFKCRITFSKQQQQQDPDLLNKSTEQAWHLCHSGFRSASFDDKTHNLDSEEAIIRSCSNEALSIESTSSSDTDSDRNDDTSSSSLSSKRHPEVLPMSFEQHESLPFIVDDITQQEIHPFNSDDEENVSEDPDIEEIPTQTGTELEIQDNIVLGTSSSPVQEHDIGQELLSISPPATPMMKCHSVTKGSEWIKGISWTHETPKKAVTISNPKIPTPDSTKKKFKAISGGFAEQLQRLRSREESARNIWLHQRTLSRNNAASSAEVHFKITCVQIEISTVVATCSKIGETPSECLILFPIRYYQALSLQIGSTISLHPPWHTLNVKYLHLPVIFCPYFLEIINEKD